MALQNLQTLGMQQPGAQGYSGIPQPNFWERFGQGTSDFFLGKQPGYEQVPNKTPQQMEYLQNLLSQTQKGFQDPYAGFEPIEQQALKRFNTQTVPGLAERFTAAGGQSRGSSAFQGALGSASSDLGERLSALKSQYGLQNRQQLLQEGAQGLTSQFDTRHNPGSSGFLEQLLNQVVSSGLGAFTGQFGQQMGRTAGNKAFGENTGSDQMAMLMKILPLLGV